MSVVTQTVSLAPLTSVDLELLLAWRSHPDIYNYFKIQSGPLVWEEHQSFWLKRTHREDFLILLQEEDQTRKVGSINISKLNTEYPEIGVLVGELSIQGKGVGKKAVRLALNRLKELGHNKARVEINSKNHPSVRLFTTLGFVKENTTSTADWQTYVLESIP